jgi:CRP/FNR family cyclic AMP-dependent transcriptional regulator
MAIPDLLRGCPLFFELYDSEIERITRFCAVTSHEPGGAIVREGQEGDEIFVILEGSAYIEKQTQQGPLRIHTLRKGDPFGELVLVDERKRSADIVAAENCSVLEMHYSQIFSLYEEEPRIFGLIMLNLSRLLARRMRETNLSLQALRERLAAPVNLAELKKAG